MGIVGSVPMADWRTRHIGYHQVLTVLATPNSFLALFGSSSEQTVTMPVRSIVTQECQAPPEYANWERPNVPLAPHKSWRSANNACVHCGPEGIVHAIASCPAFVTTRAHVFPDLATSNNPMEAIAAYLYHTGPKENHLLAFLYETDLASRS